MSALPKLVIVSCSGYETAELARQIHRILREDHGLDDHVELLLSKQRSEVPKDVGKDHRAPLVMDYFGDREVEVDTGRNDLKDGLRGRHVAIVEHLLTPVRTVFPDSQQVVTINDHIMTVRGLLNVLGHVDTLQKTLIAPYLPYVRSHSVGEYVPRGFFQFDSLRRMLTDFKTDGLEEMICIDPHSNNAAQIATELGMGSERQPGFHGCNPFQSGRSFSPFKLGLDDGKAPNVFPELRPFQKRFAQLKQQYNDHIYVVSVDDGTEARCENFVERAFPELTPQQFYALITYFGKERATYGDPKMVFKPFSKINEANIDRDGVYIIIDDMFASGGTSNKAAKILKDLGVKRVEVWTSHAVTMPEQYAKANDRQYINHVVCLDIVPQCSELSIEYIQASAPLLAAELYKAHQKLVSTR